MGLYNWRKDKTLSLNLFTGTINKEIKQADSTLKLMLQLFNYGMINNKMHVTTIQKK